MFDIGDKIAIGIGCFAVLLVIFAIVITCYGATCYKTISIYTLDGELLHEYSGRILVLSNDGGIDFYYDGAFYSYSGVEVHTIYGK